MPPIVNCHAHTFTIDHVPRKFLPLGLPVLLRRRWIRRPLVKLVDALWPFSNKDQLSRFARFVELTYNCSQEDLFDKLAGYYPADTRFVVLAMDMEYMGAGNVRAPLEAQIEELAGLRRKHDGRILPFVAADPRRPDVAGLVRRAVDEHGFAGIKLYPPLGFWPQDARLDPVYAFANERSLPIITHTSPGGVYYRGKLTDALRTHPGTGAVLPKAGNRDFTDHFTDPDNFAPVLERYPDLRLCFAHFGGGHYWRCYLDDPWNESHLADNWVHKIRALLARFPNAWTDISYTLHDARITPLLSLFLLKPELRERVLYGTDFYMLEQDASEREVSMRFRYAIGEANFKAMAVDNPRAFLGL
jgi:predicted TIM-barrel fold metal-dependent hydrolase